MSYILRFSRHFYRQLKHWSSQKRSKGFITKTRVLFSYVKPVRLCLHIMYLYICITFLCNALICGACQFYFLQNNSEFICCICNRKRYCFCFCCSYCSWCEYVSSGLFCGHLCTSLNMGGGIVQHKTFPFSCCGEVAYYRQCLDHPTYSRTL